jgi:hypothetical protein
MDPVQKGPLSIHLSQRLSRELCITTLSDHYEFFGAPIRVKRTAHISGQILNCLRPLGRV